MPEFREALHILVEDDSIALAGSDRNPTVRKLRQT